MSELPAFRVPGQEPDITMPRFYMRPVQNAFRSKQEGRPIFDDVEYVEILIPGQKSTVDERVKDEHRDRWPRQYEAFKAGQEAAQDGWALEEWPGLTRSQVEELKFFHVRTVETLAALDDGALAKVFPMGGFAIREKAQRDLAAAAGSAPTDALAAENAQLREKMAVMEETIETLRAELEQARRQSERAA